MTQRRSSAWGGMPIPNNNGEGHTNCRILCKAVSDFWTASVNGYSRTFSWMTRRKLQQCHGVSMRSQESWLFVVWVCSLLAACMHAQMMIPGRFPCEMEWVFYHKRSLQKTNSWITHSYRYYVLLLEEFHSASKESLASTVKFMFQIYREWSGPKRMCGFEP